MEYAIADIEGTFSGSVVRSLGGGEYVIRIDEREHEVRLVSTGPGMIEFFLDGAYHKARYLSGETSGISLLLDGVPAEVRMNPGLDKVVYKNSGGGGPAGAQTALKSQIPGKVVSVDAAEGAAVKKGDLVCTLESMKMQVGIKAHRDGTISSIKVKEGGSVSKNDVIAEIS